MTVNGVEVGEIGQVALIAGHYNVPMVLVTGDEAACSEASGLIPGIGTVAVKKGLSRYSALSIPPPRAREMVREGARKSLALIGRIKPCKLSPPYVWREEFFRQLHEPGVTREGDAAVLDRNVREIRADTIVELVRKVFGYT
jgi:D-aminopeptidase